MGRFLSFGLVYIPICKMELMIILLDTFKGLMITSALK